MQSFCLSKIFTEKWPPVLEAGAGARAGTGRPAGRARADNWARGPGAGTNGQMSPRTSAIYKI